MRGIGFRGIRLGNRTLGSSTPISPSSSLVIKSSSDVDNPAVGDILYFELDYVSSSDKLQDYTSTGTTIVFKRDGAPITLIDEATQYVVTQDDIGAVLSLEVTPKEQGGLVQSALSGTYTNAVTGSASWTLGELQTKFAGLYYPNENVYPRIQRHKAEDSTSVYKIKSINGNSIDVVAPQAGNISSFDAGSNSISGAGSAKLRFIKDIASYNADTFTYFCRFKAVNIDTFFFRDMGLGNRLFLDVPQNRIEFDGLRTADGTVNTGDEAILIVRTNSTPFTTINGVASQKTEIYLKIISGTTPGEFHQQGASEFITSFTYGFSGGVTEIATGTTPIKAFGFSTEFLNDSDMTNLINYLTII